MSGLSMTPARISGLVLLMAGICLAACAPPAQIAALQPKPGTVSLPPGPAQFRSLADLPERPMPPDSMENQETVRALNDARDKASEEGERLRNEPFAQPEAGVRVNITEP